MGDGEGPVEEGKGEEEKGAGTVERSAASAEIVARPYCNGRPMMPAGAWTPQGMWQGLRARHAPCPTVMHVPCTHARTLARTAPRSSAEHGHVMHA